MSEILAAMHEQGAVTNVVDTLDYLEALDALSGLASATLSAEADTRIISISLHEDCYFRRVMRELREWYGVIMHSDDGIHYAGYWGDAIVRVDAIV